MLQFNLENNKVILT